MAVPAGQVTQHVTRPVERPIGVELAEDQVFVPPHQARREAGDGTHVASGPAGCLAADLEYDRPEIADKPDRWQRISARDDLHRPLEGRPHRRHRRWHDALKPKTLAEKSTTRVQIPEFDPADSPIVTQVGSP